MSDTNDRLKALEQSVIKLTANVGELKAAAERLRQIDDLTKSVSELKAYLVIAGGAAAIILTGLVSVIIFLVFK